MEDTILERELLEISLLEKLSDLFELEASVYKNIELSDDDILLIESNRESRNLTYSLLDEVLIERNSEETRIIIEKIDRRILSFGENVKNLKKDEKITQMFKDDIQQLMDPPTLEPKSIIVIDKEVNNKESNEVAKLLAYIDERIKVLEHEVLESKVDDDTGYMYFKDKDNKSFEPTTLQDLNNLFNPNVNEEVNEEVKEDKISSDDEDLQKELRERASQKLTREEIDSFIKKIDDKLAELEAEEKAISSSRQQEF